MSELIPIRKIAENFKLPEQRHPVVHYLKCRVLFYQDIVSGLKTFEIRQNDRNYQVGDILMLREWDDRVDMGPAFFTGREVQRLVVYMTDFQQCPGWVVLGITR